MVREEGREGWWRVERRKFCDDGGGFFWEQTCPSNFEITSCSRRQWTSADIVPECQSAPSAKGGLHGNLWRMYSAPFATSHALHTYLLSQWGIWPALMREIFHIFRGASDWSCDTQRRVPLANGHGATDFDKSRLHVPSRAASLCLEPWDACTIMAQWHVYKSGTRWSLHVDRMVHRDIVNILSDVGTVLLYNSSVVGMYSTAIVFVNVHEIEDVCVTHHRCALLRIRCRTDIQFWKCSRRVCDVWCLFYARLQYQSFCFFFVIFTVLCSLVETSKNRWWWTWFTDVSGPHHFHKFNHRNIQNTRCTMLVTLLPLFHLQLDNFEWSRCFNELWLLAIDKSGAISPLHAHAPIAGLRSTRRYCSLPKKQSSFQKYSHSYHTPPLTIFPQSGENIPFRRDVSTTTITITTNFKKISFSATAQTFVRLTALFDSHFLAASEVGFLPLLRITLLCGLN